MEALRTINQLGQFEITFGHTTLYNEFTDATGEPGVAMDHQRINGIVTAMNDALPMITATTGIDGEFQVGPDTEREIVFLVKDGSDLVAAASDDFLFLLYEAYLEHGPAEEMHYWDDVAYADGELQDPRRRLMVRFPDGAGSLAIDYSRFQTITS